MTIGPSAKVPSSNNVSKSTAKTSTAKEQVKKSAEKKVGTTSQETLKTPSTTKPPLDLSKINLRKKVVKEEEKVEKPAKPLSFTEKALESLKKETTYKQFIEKYFDGCSIKTKSVSFKEGWSLNRKVITLCSDLFEKKRTADLSEIDYLERLLKEIEDFNKLSAPTSIALEETVAKHVEARILLFYQLCTAYYRSAPAGNIQWTGASMQINQGKLETNTEACHHALFASTNDSLFQELPKKIAQATKAFVNEGKNIDDTVLLLLSIGVTKDEIDLFIGEAQKDSGNIEQLCQKLFEKFKGQKSLLGEKSLLFLMHNHTIVTSSHLNRIDDLVEFSTRRDASDFLNDVAQGKMTPLEAAIQLNTIIEKDLSTYARRMRELRPSIEKITKISSHITSSMQSMKSRVEVAKQVDAATKDLEEAVEEHKEVLWAKKFDYVKEHKAFMENVKKVTSLFSTVQEMRQIDGYLALESKIQEEIRMKQEGYQDRVQGYRRQEEAIRAQTAAISDEKIAKAKRELLPVLERFGEGSQGKIFNCNSLGEQQKFLSMQLAATQELSRKLQQMQEVKDPAVMTTRKLAALIPLVDLKRVN